VNKVLTAFFIIQENNKEVEQMEIEFAPIDGKDQEVINIKDYWGPPHTFKNFLLMIKAQKEYLEGLSKLQQEIKDKFEPLLEDDTTVPFDDDKYLEMQDDKEANTLLNKIYHSPKFKNLFYT